MNEHLGTYEIVADSKNRLKLPLKFREHLPSELLVAGLPLGFLIVCDPDLRWEALREVPDQEGELLRLDAFGRLPMSQNLLALANLDDGQKGWAMWFSDRVEIWEKIRWENYFEESVRPFRVGINPQFPIFI